jgi:hypothetical protein
MEISFQLDELEALVHAVLDGGEGRPALEALARENETLKGRFGDDPFMAVTGELFEAAQFLNDQGCTLAKYFQESGNIDYEEKAWQLRCGPILTAHAHRRNIVGPAMLDWGNCNLRLGNVEKADAIFDSVVKDFTEILGWGPSFNGEWLLSVRCLNEAIENSSRDYGDLAVRTKVMLERSEQLKDPHTER